MNLSSWKRMVTVLAISGSSTPFQNEDSIRHVPWSLSKSCLARSVVAALASPSGERGPEQALIVIRATKTKDPGSHLIIAPRKEVVGWVESSEPTFWLRWV